MLSAKLFEDRLVLIESEEIEYMKTKFLHEVLKPYMTDRLTFLTPFEADDNFSKACRNLNNVKLANPQQFNIQHLLRSDLIFITKTGLT